MPKIYLTYGYLQMFKEAEVPPGLRESFELLDGLDDPVGGLFETKRNAVIGALTTRNNSIFGHGTEPVGREGYENVWETLHGFISVV